MSHSSTSSYAGFTLPSMTTESRPATAYSDTNQTPRQHMGFSGGSLPSGSMDQYTPYQSYNYPLPQQSQPFHHQSAPQPSAVQAHLALPPPSSNSDFDFLHSALPPVSAKSGGMTLDSYRVVSGPGSGSGSGSNSAKTPADGGASMSRCSSVSITMEAIHTPVSRDEDGEGEAYGTSPT